MCSGQGLGEEYLMQRKIPGSLAAAGDRLYFGYGSFLPV